MENEEFIRELSRRYPHRAKIKPDQSALLVVDMQEHFRPLAGQILPSLEKLICACRQQDLPVIYSQHSHGSRQNEGGMLLQWWGSLIMSGTFEAQLMPEIVPLAGEKVVAKNRYSAFYGTDLESHLRKQGIKDLIIGGVMTNLCCETTARDAFVRDFRVFFLADGTATTTEELHRATLSNLAFGFAYLVTCKQLMPILGG